MAGVDKFLSRPNFSGAQFYLRARSGTQKNGCSKPNARPIETQLQTLFFARYYLISIYSFHFLCVSFKWFRKWCFFNLNVLLRWRTWLIWNWFLLTNFSRNQVFCLKIWKLWRAPTALQFSIFCWNFAHVSYLSKGCVGFFLLSLVL